MPRRARQDAAGALHHIMVRGIKRSRTAYRQFVSEGIALGRQPQLTGGGLIRSLGGWAQVQSAQQSRQKSEYDERILGSGEFVDAVFREIEEKQVQQFRMRRSGLTIKHIIEQECTKARVSAPELRNGSKRDDVRKARETIAQRGVEELGLPAAEIARHVGVCTSTITRSLVRAGNDA